MANEEEIQPPRKKFKVTELPITQAKRSAIDSLQHTFKKKGEFDSIRKKVYAQFSEGVRYNPVACLCEPCPIDIEPKY